MIKFKWLVFFIVFFIGSNVLSTLGIESYVVSYLLIVFSVIAILLGRKEILFKERKFEFYIIGFLVLVIIYRAFAGILTDSLRSAAVLIITPTIYLLVPAEIKSKKDFLIKRKILWLLIYFYIFECSLSIIEYVLKTRIFLWVDITFESQLNSFESGKSFRSVALHGSPLTNSLIVITLSTFFLTSTIKDKYKFFLWGLGFFSTMAFNARTSIIANVALLAFYLIRLLFNRRTKLSMKFWIYLGAISFGALAAYLVIYQHLGDRLFDANSVDDSSTQSRFDAFSMFNNHVWVDFLFGTSMAKFEALMQAAGLLIVENFWVCDIILFGIIALVVLVFLYWRLFASYLKQFSLYNRTVICATFVLLASINNSLYTQYIPLLIFLVGLNLFRPDTLNLILKSKYLDQTKIARRR